MPHAFSERLAEGPVLCDGAMGTMLYARGVPLDGCFDVLNLNTRRVVQAVHADYIAAGADAIETNPFGANRFKLAVHGVEAQVREINRRGARLARDVRESAGRDVWVLGSIGPLGKYLEPLGAVTADEAREAFREQAEALLEGGRSEEHTSELQSRSDLVCRLLLEKKNISYGAQRLNSLARVSPLGVN